MAKSLEPMIKDALEAALTASHIRTSHDVLAFMSGWLSRDYPNTSDLIKKVLDKTHKFDCGRREADIFKVVVRDGHEQDFEQYCKENGIFCRAYPMEVLKTRYRVECTPEQLKGAEHIIVSVEDMAILTLS